MARWHNKNNLKRKKKKKEKQGGDWPTVWRNEREKEWEKKREWERKRDREGVREKSRFHSVAGGRPVGSIEWMLSQPRSLKRTCTAHRRSRLDKVKIKRSKPVGAFQHWVARLNNTCAFISASWWRKTTKFYFLKYIFTHAFLFDELVKQLFAELFGGCSPTRRHGNSRIHYRVNPWTVLTTHPRHQSIQHGTCSALQVQFAVSLLFFSSNTTQVSCTGSSPRLK